jgi:hypothetical protein
VKSLSQKTTVVQQVKERTLAHSLPEHTLLQRNAQALRRRGLATERVNAVSSHVLGNVFYDRSSLNRRGKSR